MLSKKEKRILWLQRRKFWLVLSEINQHHQKSINNCFFAVTNALFSLKIGISMRLSGLWTVSKTACRGFKSFCPCHSKNGLNSEFKPFFCYVCIRVCSTFSTVFLPKNRMKCFKIHRFRRVHHQKSITFSVCFLQKNLYYSHKNILRNTILGAAEFCFIFDYSVANFEIAFYSFLE